MLSVDDGATSTTAGEAAMRGAMGLPGGDGARSLEFWVRTTARGGNWLARWGNFGVWFSDRHYHSDRRLIVKTGSQDYAVALPQASASMTTSGIRSS